MLILGQDWSRNFPCTNNENLVAIKVFKDEYTPLMLSSSTHCEAILLSITGSSTLCFLKRNREQITCFKELLPRNIENNRGYIGMK